MDADDFRAGGGGCVSGERPGGGTPAAVAGPDGLASGGALAFSPERMSFGQAVAVVRREWIAHAMRKHGGNKTRVARELDVDRKTLNSMIARLGMRPGLPSGNAPDAQSGSGGN